jgi:hypothetical protein
MGDEDEEDEDDEDSVPLKKKSAKKSGKASKNGDKPKRPGVIAKIIEQLETASKNKPISKAKILKAMVKAFPDREEAAMKNTLTMQLSTGLRTEKGMEVGKNDDGYWIKSKGKKK